MITTAALAPIRITSKFGPPILAVHPISLMIALSLELS